jgi:hypothetical protein
MTTVSRVNVTWVMTAALPRMFRSGEGTPRLITPTDYATAFAQSVDGTVPWSLPWASSLPGDRFWAATLGNNYAATDDTRTAWGAAIPFAWERSAAVDSLVEGVRFEARAYAYPTGVGYTISAVCDGAYSLTSLRALLVRLGDRAVVANAAGAAGTPGAPKTIRAALQQGLDWIQSQVLGRVDSEAKADTDPLLVIDVTRTIDDGPPIESAAMLTALCLPARSTVNADAVKDRMLPPKGGDLGKHADTARLFAAGTLASWSPDRSSSEGEQWRLECYHHNRTLAALQVAVLLNTVRGAGDVLTMSDESRALVRSVVVLLGRLYGGARKYVYRTRFAVEVIDDSGLVGDVNRLREDLGVEGGALRTGL